MPRQFGETLDERFRAFAFATCKPAVVCRQPHRSYSKPQTPKLSCFSVLPSASFLNPRKCFQEWTLPSGETQELAAGEPWLCTAHRRDNDVSLCAWSPHYVAAASGQTAVVELLRAKGMADHPDGAQPHAYTQGDSHAVIVCACSRLCCCLVRPDACL